MRSTAIRQKRRKKRRRPRYSSSASSGARPCAPRRLAPAGRLLAKLAVGTIVDVSDMVTDTDGWAWLRVNSDSGGWCCAAAANGQAQLERVDDLVGDLEEESQATSARQLPWQAIVSLLESTTIASTAAAGSRGRTAVSQQHEALLNAVMDCS